MSDIIVERGKHGNFYWDASTNEAWAKSSLAILTERWNKGYYYNDPGEEPKIDSTIPDLEGIKAMPDGPMRDAAVKTYNAWVSRRKRWEREKAFYYAVKDIVEKQVLSLTKHSRYPEPVAWVALSERFEHEYEGLELERLRTADDN